ncbi:MAG: hypothetical protein OXF22_11705 [Anaerolineaceae bacterium]|nr:hypothetical protein [Anaerolineaceae bacterium]
MNEEENPSSEAEFAEDRSSSQSVRIRGLLRRAQIRIEFAGDDHDRENALSIINEALSLGATLEEVTPLLQRLSAQSEEFAARVANIEERQNLVPPSSAAPAEEEQEIAATHKDPPEDEPAEEGPPPEPSSQIPTLADEELQKLLAQLSRNYYGGEYRAAIDIANRILHHHPNQPTVHDYRQKAEEGILRGEVLDHLIPFDARVAYNRARSLARAGSYQEAKKHFQDAQELAQQAGIQRWREAEQAQLEIEDLALARELLLKGDQELVNDDWEAALSQYENALKVIPGDPQIEERKRHIREIQQAVTFIRDSLAIRDHSISEQIETLEKCNQILRSARRRLPGSARLEQLSGQLADRRQELAANLAHQAESLLDNAEEIPTIPDRLARIIESTALIDQARQLVPENVELPDLAARARERTATIDRASETLQEMERLLALGEVAALNEAFHLLHNLQDFHGDDRYQNGLRQLFAQLLAEGESNASAGRLQAAQEMRNLLQDELFQALGRAPDIERLNAAIQNRRMWRRFFSFVASGGIIILILFGIWQTRPSWQPALFPPTPTVSPSPTFSATPTATHTATHSITPSQPPTHTPTASHTPTATHTWTATQTLTPSQIPPPTLTPTPSHTPTPSITPSPTQTHTPTMTPEPVRCHVRVKESVANLRSEPNALTQNDIAQIPLGSVLAVFDWQQGVTDYPYYWLHVIYQFSGERTLEGWIRQDTLEGVENCLIDDN